jgi:hypothetical protein
MSAEQVDGEGVAPVSETPHQDIVLSPSNTRLERRLARRVKEIKDQIKRSEESQRCTNETMNLEFTI